MLTNYLQAAMRKAKYELLDDGEGYYGEIPGFRGVYSNAKTLEGCRELLQEVLEEWVFLNIADRTPLPKVSGISLKTNRLPAPALS